VSAKKKGAKKKGAKRNSAKKKNAKKKGGKKKGKPYELLTQAIFQDIVDQDSVQTIDVQHDVELQGKTTKHQIDVYWKWKLKSAGIEYVTIVQAKDWANPVKQGQLLQFKAVLDDLPGQPRGVFVTSSGYQSGAKTFADNNGIMLYELYEGEGVHVTVNLGGWAMYRRITSPPDSPKRIFAEVTTFSPTVKHLDFLFAPASQKSLRAALKANQISKNLKDVLLYDSSDSVVGTVHDIFIVRAIEEMPEEDVLTAKKACSFEKPRWLKLVNPSRSIKLIGLSAQIEIEKQPPRRHELNRPDLAHYVLKNLASGVTSSFQMPKI